MKRQYKVGKETGNWTKITKRAAVMLLVSVFCLSTGELEKVAAEENEFVVEGSTEASVTEIDTAGIGVTWNDATETGVPENDAAEASVAWNDTAEAGVAWNDTAKTSVTWNGTAAAAAMEPVAAGMESYFDGWVQDDAGLLTLKEEEELEEECGRLFQAHGAGVYIVTTPDFGGGDIKDWQRRIFSQYDLGADSGGSGVMLAISMAERDWGLVGFGAAQEAFSTYARERLGSLILDDLSEGEFYQAFSRYLSIADDCFLAAEEGTPYTEQHRYREGWRLPMIIGVAFLLSLGVSTAVVMSWKKGMNTRVRQKGAMEYLKAGSFYLSNQSDLFLYHTVSRTQRPKQDTSSGSGSMHSDSSGTSGKF